MRKTVGILIAFALVACGFFLLFLTYSFSFKSIPPDADPPPFFLQVEKSLPESIEIDESSTDESNKKQKISEIEKPVPIFVLKIPAISLKTQVYEGTTKRVLMSGPGHLKGSAMPGKSGNCVISGHRVTFGGPFYRLDRLHPGDLIIIEHGQKRYLYEVKWVKRVKPDEVWVVKITSTPSVTLTTCDPPFSSRYRLVVRGELIDTE